MSHQCRFSVIFKKIKIINSFSQFFKLIFFDYQNCIYIYINILSENLTNNIYIYIYSENLISNSDLIAHLYSENLTTNIYIYILVVRFSL